MTLHPAKVCCYLGSTHARDSHQHRRSGYGSRWLRSDFQNRREWHAQSHRWMHGTIQIPGWICLSWVRGPAHDTAYTIPHMKGCPTTATKSIAMALIPTVCNVCCPFFAGSVPHCVWVSRPTQLRRNLLTCNIWRGCKMQRHCLQWHLSGMGQSQQLQVSR